MANWEKKSAYLLREIVKFRTYIDSLTAAHHAKEVLTKEREATASTSAQASSSADPMPDIPSTYTNANLASVVAT
jgi:hypothetical protein